MKRRFCALLPTLVKKGGCIGA